LQQGIQFFTAVVKILRRIFRVPAEKLFRKRQEELNIPLAPRKDRFDPVEETFPVKQQHEDNRQTDHHGEHSVDQTGIFRSAEEDVEKVKPFCIQGQT